MFYSHEILTKRKYGVATVWLVATLGSKSALRKVGRKDILAVNLPKACDTVMHPEAPLALRLQSSLLIGIARVYSQQFQYLYHDVSAAHNGIRKLNISGEGSVSLDLTRNHVALPEQLTLPDDPAFLPELDVYVGQLSLGDLGLGDEEMLDVPSLVTERSPIASPGLPSPGFPTSPGSFAAGTGLAPSSSHIGRFGLLPGEQELREPEILEDLGFEFDAEGQIRETTPRLPSPARPRDSLLESVASPAAGARAPRSVRGRESHLDSDDIAAQVLREHETGQEIVKEGEETGQFIPHEDVLEFPEDVQPFPYRTRSAEEQAARLSEAEYREEEKAGRGEEGAVVRKRRTHKPIPITVDESIELSVRDIKNWHDNYLENMDMAREDQQYNKEKKQAKANANILVMEWGIGGQLINPLLKEMFSGKAIIDAIRKKKQKPPEQDGRETGEESELEAAARRPEEEIGLGIRPEDNTLMRDIEEGPEVGREEPEIPPDEIHSDFPWNQLAIPSSRTGSVVPGEVFSANEPPSSSTAGRRFSELGSARGSVPASPLAARGSRLERVSSVERVLGDVQEEDTAALTQGAGEAVEFEFFGRGVEIDTQGAAGSQWLANTMERESYNFLEFVKSELAKLQQGEEEEEVNFITFDQLIDPKENRQIVAAQGLSHTLLLATRGLIYVSQEEPYGPIQISIPAL